MTTGIGAVVYQLPGALVGYVVGMIAANFIPDGRGACDLPPERSAPADEAEQGTEP